MGRGVRVNSFLHKFTPPLQEKGHKQAYRALEGVFDDIFSYFRALDKKEYWVIIRDNLC